METTSLRLSDLITTAVAPAAWGTTYLVTERFLPDDRPLFAATVRALPAGIALLLLVRRLPRGAWWWRSAVLGVTNIGLFFPLLFLGAYHLPGGLAATLQALSPLAVMGLAWAVIAERPAANRILGAFVGLVGVSLLVLRAGGRVDTIGLLAAIGSVLVSAVGFVLVKRWSHTEGTPEMLTLVSWQLVWGGLVLLPLGLLVEGPPPALTTTNIAGFVWLATAGTALAYWCWFRGLSRMPAGAAALVGLLNPVVGTLLGVVVAGEVFGWTQAVGMLLVLGGVVAGQIRPSRRIRLRSVLAEPRSPRRRIAAGVVSR